MRSPRFLSASLLAALALSFPLATTVVAAPTPAAPSPSPSDSPCPPGTPPPFCPSPSPLPIATPSPSPSPSPSPVPPAELELSDATGSPGDKVTVDGRYFGVNQTIHLDWDSPGKVLGATTADVHGSFSLDVTIPTSPAGTHNICAVEVPQACASFGLLAAVPTPSPSESPSPSPSPSESPSPPPENSAPTGAQGKGGDSNLVGALFSPPLVFLPALLLIGLVALAVWYWRSRTAPGPVVIRARVSHAVPGEEPGEPTPGWRPPSAAATVEPGAAVEPPPATPPAAPEPPPDRPWTGPQGGDEPPDLPQPSE